MTEPQLAPSVEREQLPFWVVVVEPQEPLAQVWVVTDRERVPLSSQAFEKPPQLLQLPFSVAAQVVPVVEREQAPVSLLVLGSQLPAWQV